MSRFRRVERSETRWKRQRRFVKKHNRSYSMSRRTVSNSLVNDTEHNHFNPGPYHNPLGAWMP